MRIVALTEEQYEMVEQMVDNDQPRITRESMALNRAAASQLHNGYTQQALRELRDKLRTFRGDADLSLMQHVYLEECRATLSVILDDAAMPAAIEEERQHRADYLGFGYVKVTTPWDDEGRVLVVVAPNGRQLQWDWDESMNKFNGGSACVNELPPIREMAEAWEARQ